MLEKLSKCDGEGNPTHECRGEVVKVEVVGWGYFNYCQAAIENDEGKNFIVNIVKEETGRQQQ